MAEEQKIGYVYLNAANTRGYEILNDLNQATARYKITDPDNMIIYIESIESPNNRVDGGKLYSNTYYFLGKSGETHTIRGDCWEVYMRGAKNGVWYNSTEMDTFQYNGSWDMTGKTEYTLGGSGTNGRIDYDYVPLSDLGFPHNMLGFSHKSYNVEFPNAPDKNGIYIGWTAEQLTSMVELYHYVNYPSKPSMYKSRIVKPEYLHNIYSSAYTIHLENDIPWWTDMQDIRTFYYTHHIYPDGNPELLLQDDYVVFDGYPLFLNFHTTHSLEAAQKYLRDGTIPSDDGYIPSDDGTPPTGKEDSGGDDDDMDGMNNTEHSSSQSIYKAPTTHFYHMSITELQAFTTWFWNDILTLMKSDVEALGDITFNAITGAYSNISQYINSVKKLNVDIHKYFQLEGNRHVTLGRYTFDAQNTIEVLHDNPSMLLTAEYRIPFKHSNKRGNPTHGAFLDYDPYTTISLYIPFIGIVPLQTNMVMGRQVRLYSAVDIYAGTIHYNVYVSTPKKEWSLIGTYEGKCGVEVPLTLDDSLGNATNILQNVAGATVGLCTGNFGALATIGNSVFSQPINQVSGISTNTSYYNPNQCAIIIQTTPATIPDNFGSTVGYLYRQSAKLESLSGLTTCLNPRIGNFNDNTPTDSERAEIYSLLETGVII